MSIGYHIHKEGRAFIPAIGEDIARAKSHGINMKTFQIFAVGPRNSKVNVTAEDLVFILGLRDEGYRVIVHGSYLDHPWGEKSAGALHIIKSEFRLCEAMKAYGMIIHLPKEHVDKVIPVLNKILEFKPKDLILYLEVGSVKASANTYETPEKIAALFAQIKDPMVGFCVDTAHLWSTGVDISSAKTAGDWINKFRAIGIKHVTIALNDQTRQRGSGVDAHAPLTYGTLFGKYNFSTGTEGIANSGMIAFLDWALLDNIPVILERHDDSPKFNGEPKIKNIDSDLILLHTLGYFKTA
jgi:endonuclease IV